MPLTKLQAQVLAVIKDAKGGEISGLSIATWLLRRRRIAGVCTCLRTLEARGLITMRVMNELTPEYPWPDRLKAMYSIRKEESE